MAQVREEANRSIRLAIGVGHVVLGIGLFLALVAVLGAKYLPVTTAVVLMSVLLTGSGAALLIGAPRHVLAGRIAAGTTLVLGLAGITALVWVAAYLDGIYGDLGRGASAMFTLIVFTVLPYLVIYPAVALVLLGRCETPAAVPDADTGKGKAKAEAESKAETTEAAIESPEAGKAPAEADAADGEDGAEKEEG
jgi:hypothetical protein